MLVITIELWPGGDRSRKQLLGAATIANDGTGTATAGHYTAVLSRRRGAGIWKEVRVLDFPRRRLGAYDLLYRVLRAAVGERNG